MLWLYNIGISFYGLLLRVVSIFNTKAKFFIQGRKNIFTHIRETIDSGKPHVWFHFASLGEFEQGRPVLEKIREIHPEKRIVVTFFSPSGYEVRKNYTLAAGVFYLPLDTAGNAKRFIAAIRPELAIFTKYEYWYHYFKTLNDQQIPLYVISGIFRPGQIFFKWYGTLNRKMLSYVTHFFVQNEESVKLLKSLHIENVSLSGDTRFDRVAENAASPREMASIAAFCGSSKVFIAGSSWPADEQLLQTLIRQQPEWKFIIAPHEVDAAHIQEIEQLIPGAIRYSNLSETKIEVQTLIIDNIGLLSSIYQYGDLCYIGGGFGVGIHNTLEAAAFGLPVIFGPKYDKFQEAKDLIAAGAAITISNETELIAAFDQLKNNPEASDAAKNYVKEKTGSTLQILQHLSTSL